MPMKGKMPMKPGKKGCWSVMRRAGIYTQELADMICERLAQGESLNAICADEGLPAESTVRGWHLDDVQGFGAKYARARELGYERHAEEIIALADACRVGTKTTVKANGDEETVTGDMVDRSRLQIESRKWILSKMLPKKYGDKLALGGADGLPPIEQSLTVQFIGDK